MDVEKKPIGLISIVAYSNGDIELKFAGIEKDKLPTIFEQIKNLVTKNEN
jgi:hypothetical protein